MICVPSAAIQRIFAGRIDQKEPRMRVRKMVRCLAAENFYIRVWIWARSGACHPFQEKNKTCMMMLLRAEYRPMTPEEKIALNQHVQAIAKTLHADVDKPQMTNLRKIEAGIRAQLQSYMSPKLGFFITEITGTIAGYVRTVKSILGNLPWRQKQGQTLGVEVGKQISPHLELCWLRISANVSYANAELDLAVLMGMTVSDNDMKRKPAHSFCRYLAKHRHRIINYLYYQAEGICSIGSGTLASATKQIDRQVQMSGAQWKAENAPQVLAHRAVYLNGLFYLEG